MPETTDIWADKSPQIKIIQHRYERADVQNWTNARVAKLAQDLGTTVWILCAEAGAFKPDFDAKRGIMRLRYDKQLVKRCWRTNFWPAPLALGFEILERFVKARNGSAIMLGVRDRVALDIITGKVA